MAKYGFYCWGLLEGILKSANTPEREIENCYIAYYTGSLEAKLLDLIINRNSCFNELTQESHDVLKTWDYTLNKENLIKAINWCDSLAISIEAVNASEIIESYKDHYALSKKSIQAIKQYFIMWLSNSFLNDILTAQDNLSDLYFGD